MAFVAPWAADRAMMQRSGFARGVMVLLGGAVGGQLLLVAASPILTRLYVPSDFGGLAVYSGVLAVAMIVACSRYELAIPLPTNNVEALCIVAICVSSAFLLALGLGIGIAAYGHLFVRTFNIDKIEPYLWALPVGVFLGGCYRAFYYYAVRQQEFVQISKTRVAQVGAQLLVQLAGASYGLGALVVALLIGQSVGAPRLSLVAFRGGEFRSIRFKTVKSMALAYKRFPLFDTWSALLNTAAYQTPPLFIAAYFGPASAGIYLLAMRVLLLPVDMVGSAIGTSLHAVGRDHASANTLDKAVSQVLILCLDIAMPGLLALFLLSPHLFPLLFGTEWAEGGVVVQILLPLALVRFCTSPISVVAFIQQRQAALLGWQLSYFLLTFTALFLAHAFGFRATVLSYALTTTAWYFVLGAGIVLGVGASIALIVAAIARSLCLSFLICLPLLLTLVIPMPLWAKVACAAMFLFALGAYYWRVTRRFLALELGKAGAAEW